MDGLLFLHTRYISFYYDLAVKARRSLELLLAAPQNGQCVYIYMCVEV